MSLLNNLQKLDGIDLSRDKDERIIRDDEWVRKLNLNDKKAFEEMYKCYYPQLYYFLQRYLHNNEIIEDTIQLVFFNVWKNREKMEARGTLKSYLFTAVRNQALKHIQKEKKTLHNTDQVNENNVVNINNPENAVELKELNEAYQLAVKKLPDKRRCIFLMHRQDQLTYKEIASILNISVKTVETQISRSLKFLANSLSKYI